MGNSSSTSNNNKNKRIAQEKKRQQQEDKEVRKRGVLIPPSFGVVADNPTTTTNTTLSCLSLRDRLPYMEPSLIDDLHVMDPSSQILYNFIRPGLWLKAQVTTTLGNGGATTSTTPTDAIVSFPTDTGHGRLVATYPWNNGTTKVCLGTHQGPPMLTTSIGVVPGSLYLLGKLGADGKGWIGTHLDYAFKPDILHFENSSNNNNNSNNKWFNIRLGSWIIPTGSLFNAVTTTTSSASSNNSTTETKATSILSNTMKEVNGYAAIQSLGATIAFQAKLPMDTLEPQTKSYFNINLTDSGAGGGGGPPLLVTLERSSHEDTSALSLSQIVTFDRYQLNPVEDRAPYIRNTAAWTVRLERNHDTTNFAVGGAWQINRGVAMKATLQNNHELTTAVLFKRWKQPRVACSVLFRHDLSSSSSFKSHFVGIGLEVEPVANQEQVDYYGIAANNKAAYLDNQDVPETKATLS